MRRHDHILHVPQLRVRGEGFRVGDVEGGAGELGGFQRVDQAGLVDDGAARGVDQQWSWGWACCC